MTPAVHPHSAHVNIANHISVSGPSVELREFQYRIFLRREQRAVPADITVYTAEGEISGDIPDLTLHHCHCVVTAGQILLARCRASGD